MYADILGPVCICMYAYVHACTSSLYSSVTVHQFDMSLNKYGYHIAHMAHTVISLNRHMDQVPKHEKVHQLFPMLLPCMCHDSFFFSFFLPT